MSCLVLIRLKHKPRIREFDIAPAQPNNLASTCPRQSNQPERIGGGLGNLSCLFQFRQRAKQSGVSIRILDDSLTCSVTPTLDSAAWVRPDQLFLDCEGEN